MVHYMFETEWELTAPIEQVFEELARPEEFQDWWPSVTRSTRLSEGDASGVGAHASYTIRGPLLYSLTFDLKTIEIDRPHRMGAVVRGDLIGTGTYYLDSTGTSTHVRFNWYVSTTKPWMNVAGKLAKPILAWAHDHVMREGCHALARHLNASLIWVRTDLVDAPTPVPAGQQ